MSAVIMAARGASSTKAENIIWILLAFALFGSESVTLYREKAQSDEAAARNLENSRKLSQQIELSIARSKEQFSQTIDQENGILKTTRSIGELAYQSLQNLTGGASMPVVLPNTLLMNGTAIPLAIWNWGENVLTGVSIRIIPMEDYDSRDFKILFEPVIEIGNLPPSTLPKSLGQGQVITPKPDNSGMDSYTIEIYTQGSFFQELLQFRQSKYPGLQKWAYRFNITRIRFPKMRPSKQLAWSDDLIHERSLSHK